MEARDLARVGMRMGWQLSWRQIAVETAPFPDRHAGRQTNKAPTAECVNMKGGMWV